MIRTMLHAGAGAALLMAAAGPALAQRAVESPSAAVATPTAPTPGMEDAWVTGGDFTSHLQGEVTKPSDTSAKATVFDDSDANVYVNYSTWLSLYGNLHLERNRNDNANDYFPTSNTAFRSEGLTMRQLFVALRPTSALTLYGGKIHPNFGSAFALMPGNFYNFASDYEQTERIGAGVEYRLPELPGLNNARISLETYYLDTSLLSNSLLSRPSLTDPTADRARRFSLGQYGPSNTARFDSFTASLRGGRPEAGLTYQVSYEQQGTDDPSGKTERGGSIGLMLDPGGGDGISLGRRLGVIPFVEYAQFANFGGTADDDRRYLLGGLAFHYVRWEMDVDGGLRRGDAMPLDNGASTAGLDRQENVSLNYTLSPYPLITAGLGINHIDVAGKGGSWSGGPSLSYEAAF